VKNGYTDEMGGVSGVYVSGTDLIAVSGKNVLVVALPPNSYVMVVGGTKNNPTEKMSTANVLVFATLNMPPKKLPFYDITRA
jgi:hypothetical protein